MKKDGPVFFNTVCCGPGDVFNRLQISQDIEQTKCRMMALHYHYYATGSRVQCRGKISGPELEKDDNRGQAANIAQSRMKVLEERHRGYNCT